jgi:hypothetical protein
VNVAGVLSWIWKVIVGHPPVLWLASGLGWLDEWGFIGAIHHWSGWSTIANHPPLSWISSVSHSSVIWSWERLAWWPVLIGGVVASGYAIHAAVAWWRGAQVKYTVDGCRLHPDTGEDREKPVDRNKAITRSVTWRRVLWPLYLGSMFLIISQWVSFTRENYVSIVLLVWLTSPLRSIFVIAGARRAYQKRYKMYFGTDDEIPPLLGSLRDDVRGYFTRMLTWSDSNRRTNAERQKPFGNSGIYRLFNWVWLRFGWKGGTVWSTIRINPLILVWSVSAQFVVSWPWMFTLPNIPFWGLKRADGANDVKVVRGRVRDIFSLLCRIASRSPSLVGTMSFGTWTRSNRRVYACRLGPALMRDSVGNIVRDENKVAKTVPPAQAHDWGRHR